MKQLDQKIARPARRAQAGMTLVEVMVGLVLSSMLVTMTGFQNSGSTGWLRLTNAVAGTQIVSTQKATL
jgi:prepilin-type N-terminal cleavage/methylation domain-containing protein